MAVITKWQVRRDTAANWTASDPVLAAGEIGLETDTGRVKTGNGITSWSSLQYSDRRPIINAALSGWLPDGTDRSAEAAAVFALASSLGGDIYFPPAALAYRADSQLTVPRTAGAPSQVQKSIRLYGSGGGRNWYAAASGNASILDLRSTAATGAKLNSLGRGTIEIDHLVIKDGGASNTTPFVLVTNTVANLHDCTFIGTGNVAQDAIIMGGAGAVITDDFDGIFQGYGSVIERCHFTNGNRGVYCRSAANSIIIADCSWQGNTGTRALELLGHAAGGANLVTGVVVRGCIFEMDVYQYGCVMTQTKWCKFEGNDFYDSGGGWLGDYYLTGNAFQNLFILGLCGGTKPFVGDSTSLQTSTIISANATRRDVNDRGQVGTELAYPLVVKGTYTAGDAYAGQITAASMFGSPSHTTLGWDDTNVYGVVDAKAGIGTYRDLVLNPSGGVVRLCSAIGERTQSAHKRTTDATPSDMVQMALDDNTVYWVEADVVGRDEAGVDRATYKIWVQTYRQGGGAATLGAGGVKVLAIDETDAALDGTFVVAANNIKLQVTGKAGTNISWYATLRWQGVSVTT